MKKTNLLSVILTLVCINLYASEPAASPKPVQPGQPVVPPLQFQSAAHAAAGTVSPIGIPLSASSWRSSQNSESRALSPASPRPPTPLTAAAVAPLASASAAGKQSDEKQAAEVDAQTQIEECCGMAQTIFTELEEVQYGLGASTMINAAVALDARRKNNRTLSYVYKYSAKTIAGLNPSAPANPKVRYSARQPMPGAAKAQDELIVNGHVKRLLTAISDIPQADGTLDLSAVQEETVLHFSRSIAPNGPKAGTEGSQPRTATTSLNLDPNNAELLRLKAELRSELTPVVAEELRDELTQAALSKKLRPKVRKKLKEELAPEVRKELAAEIRANQKSTHWTYVAYVGASCAIGGLSYWAYKAFGTKPSQTQQK